MSSPRYVRSAVIQGSCSGPLLFLVYINDLMMDVFNADVNFRLYADDVQLCVEVRSVSERVCFQDCLDSLYHWSVVWQLSISCLNCCTVDTGKLPGQTDDQCQCYLGGVTQQLGEPESVSDLNPVYTIQPVVKTV